MTLTPDTLCAYMKRYPAFAADVFDLFAHSQEYAISTASSYTTAKILKYAARVGTALELADELDRSVA